MKRIRELFRSARKLEIALAIVAAAVLALMLIEQGAGPTASGTAEEMRLERLLERIEGAGQVSVLLGGGEGAYSGCVVVAGGAEDMRVCLKMQRAVMAATDLPLEKIEIIPSGG